jgi:hypothetical protein
MFPDHEIIYFYLPEGAEEPIFIRELPEEPPPQDSEG